MPNRNIAPGFNTVEKIEIQRAEKFVLDNGVETYVVNAGTQELIRIEFLFDAGMYFQERTLVASSANAMLECGTKTHTADQLSEELDFYGSFFECSVGQNKSSVTLFSLNKYLESSLVFVEDMIKNSVIPDDELKLFLDNKKQTHLVNSQKVNILARRRFSELLFGEKHPYGINASLNDFETIKKEDIEKFYNKYYHAGNCTIVVSGKTPSNIIEVLNKHFGKNWTSNKESRLKEWTSPDTTKEHKHFISKDDAVQSAIKIGRLLFPINHEDFIGFSILNTALGGYFGSRLMANIREDKGYTYGIGSGISTLNHTCYFSIGTEVGIDVTQATLNEIYKELKTLREEAIPDSELETIRNYLLGQLLRSSDGAFALGDKFKGIWQYGLGYDYYEKTFQTIKTIDAKKLQDLANKYLQEKDLIELVVGKK